MNSNLQIRLPRPAPLPRGARPGLGVQQDPRHARAEATAARAPGCACAPPPAEHPCCPRGAGLAGAPGTRCPAGDRKLNGPPRAGTPLVAGLQDPNPALSEAAAAGRGPSWLRSPSPLPIAHVERWVDAALALRCCQIISGHRRRRTLQGARGRRSRGVLGPVLGCAAGGTALPAAGGRDPSRRAGRAFPAASPQRCPPAVAWVGRSPPPPASPSSPPAASAVRHPALG